MSVLPNSTKATKSAVPKLVEAEEQHWAEICRHDRLIGDMMARLVAVEMRLARQQEIIDAAIDAATRGVRP